MEIVDPDKLSDKEVKLIALGFAVGYPDSTVLSNAGIEPHIHNIAVLRSSKRVTEKLHSYIKDFEAQFDFTLAGTLARLDADRDYAARLGDVKTMLAATQARAKVLGQFVEKVEHTSNGIALPDPTMSKEDFLQYAYQMEKLEVGSESVN